MTSRKVFRRRRHRRGEAAVRRHGKGAKPKHALPGGRTGSLFAKRPKSKKPLRLHIIIELRGIPTWWRVGP